jgi:tetratricopeptide (TPR) repeat protein
MIGIRALVDLGEVVGAVARLKQAAADLEDKGKTDDALQLLIEAAKLHPSDAELRAKLMDAAFARGDLDAARTYASGPEQLKQIADGLFEQGRDDEALSVLSAAAESSPDDPTLRAELAKRLIARGDADSARSVLTSDVAGVDAELLWMLAETELREGRVTDGIATLERVLEADPGKRDALVILGCEVATANPDAGFACLDVATRTAIAADEWGSAAAALNEFVTRVPNHIPALARLVEICVDGGLEATLHSAQAQLADAYLVAGSGAEASVIAEDLVAREPWERANIERFRRALTLLGEENIDAIIAERLSGQTPFTSTDFLWPAEPAGTELAPTPMVTEPPPVPEFAPPPPEPPTAVVHELREEPAPVAREEPPAPAPEPQPAQPPGRRDPHEIDLSDIFGTLKHPEEAATPPAPKKPDVSPETIEEQFKLAGDYLQMGMIDEAIKAFEMASRSPRHRFRAASALARLYVDKGESGAAIEWFERAAEAPTPDPESHYALLYDLAAALEAQGENARALAVFLELQAEAGDYRDLTARLGHLTAALKG